MLKKKKEKVCYLTLLKPNPYNISLTRTFKPKAHKEENDPFIHSSHSLSIGSQAEKSGKWKAEAGGIGGL